jgi:hypothetical protein
VTAPITSTWSCSSDNVKYLTLGHPVLNEIVGKLRMSARSTTDEAVERMADLVRHGDRTQLLTLLGGAAFVGWMDVGAAKSRRCVE